MEQPATTNNKADIISGLSDSLLCHILSFLSIKEAISTSLISKRWRTLWLSLPTLYLPPHQYFMKLPSFYRFIDKLVGSLHLKSVKKFVLDFDLFRQSKYFRRSKISKWINAVIIHNNVEHLEIHLMRRDSYVLPSRVFAADKIRVLKLSEVNVATLSHVDLPLLEVLHLKDIKFHDLRSLEMLITACPLLKELVIKSLDGVELNPLKIERIDHLATAEVPNSLFPLKVLSNVKFLALRQDVFPLSDVKAMFYNLTHLECVIADGWIRMVNCLHNFPKLEKLVVSESPSHNKDDSPAGPLEPITEPPMIFDVPPCVPLHLKEFTLCYYRDAESKFEMIKFIREHARVLKTLTINRAGPDQDYVFNGHKKLAAYLESGSESCSDELQPLVFMIA